MTLMLLMLFFALAATILGAELLVRGAAQLAAMFRVSPLMIGLTIISFGTSAPELVVSIKGALTNHSDLVVGNCVGSNIFNLLFIIGACAVVTPLVITKQLVILDVPIMIASHVLFLLVSIDGKIERPGALLLLTVFAVYYGFVIYKSRTEKDLSRTCSFGVPSRTIPAVFKQLGLIIIGLILCILGADRAVDLAVALARISGVSELIIGLTIISIGTSLPEVATSIVATMRGQRDIAIGNVIGSCIFNILGIIGVAGLVAPNGIIVAPSILRFDLPIVIVASIACLPIFFTDHKISRWEGLLFLCYYMAYLTYLILAAQQHDLTPMFSIVMLWFVMPLTVVTFMVITYRAIRNIR